MGDPRTIVIKNQAEKGLLHLKISAVVRVASYTALAGGDKISIPKKEKLARKS